MNDPANQPVYVHCAGGRHRTGVMTAVYRMTHDGWNSEQAFKKMRQFNFGADCTRSSSSSCTATASKTELPRASWICTSRQRTAFRADTLGVRNESWPFRRSDALFVVAVVLVALPAQETDWGVGMPLGPKVTLVIAAVAAWIRFRIFGRRDQETR